jgi:hypothetical protein
MIPSHILSHESPWIVYGEAVMKCSANTRWLFRTANGRKSNAPHLVRQLVSHSGDYMREEIEAAGCCETFIHIYQIRRCKVPEECNLCSQYRKKERTRINLLPYSFFLCDTWGIVFIQLLNRSLCSCFLVSAG